MLLRWLFILTVVSPTYAQIPQTSLEALERVNYHRTLCHVDSSKIDAKLNLAADNHADYVKQNCNISEVHYETQGNPGYTGYMVNQRATTAGYANKGSISEDIAFTDTPDGAVDTWICSFYHRIPVIWQYHYNIGYGERPISCGNPWLTHVNVMDFDLALKTNNYVFYPFPGQNQIPIAWETREGPEPFPRLTYPRGFPITVTLPTTVGKKWKTKQYNLERQAGGRVVTYIDEPSRATGYQDPYFFPHQNSLCIVSQELLEDNTVYKVTIVLDLDGNDTSDTSFQWHFGTGNSNPPLDTKYDIDENADNILLYPNPMTKYIHAAVSTEAVMEVYTVTGRLINTITGNDITWYGHDTANYQVPAGVYLYRITTGGISQNGKILKTQ